ncbi:hypothetical protein OHS59_44155 [Streptomyces sp. NBC_00414]|uniref:hypothetical protein n=1 Tax=Streptomyces sp. NBC_00414 TaxID=2975739 RepID=UPI002E1D4D72
MFIRTSFVVPAPAGARVPLPTPRLLHRPPGRLASLHTSEMNTSHSADGTGVHLSSQSYVRPVSLQPSPQ